MNTIIAYRHADSLFKNVSQWDALAGGVPFRQSTWLQPWCRHFGLENELLFVTVLDDNGDVMGVLPLQRCGRRGWQTIAGDNVCTDHVSVLARPENLSIVTTAIADFLIENANDAELGWDRLAFDGIVAGDPGMRELLLELGRRDAAIRLTTRMNIWLVPCQDNWDTFLKASSKGARRRYQKALRQIGEASTDDGKTELSIRIARDEQSVSETVEKLIELHQRHWQSQGEPGTYATRRMREFILESALESLEQDRLFLPSLVRTDPKTGVEQVIATQLYQVGDDGRLYCYSTGVDYDFAKLKPGALLNTFILKHAHDLGSPGVDLMRGDEEYKKRLHAQPIPSIHATVAAPTLQGRCNRVMSDLAFRCKQIARKRLGRPLVQTPFLEQAFDQRYLEFLPTDDRSFREGPAKLAGADNENDNETGERPIILSFASAFTAPCNLTANQPIDN
ncbi:GNAT family N-acetyltransferase [Aporhodopirellula aestuarii]|uniref:GNAT family N-acetyltransferase n=1 Tax=Aporhodopirellula aestuarii TaxID=2950107 RepID=A0ABT0U6N0_9BACT|nr:GNAT family N-acetyltransferase [Aporhodopirellula aestuarii]MCM2372555.1 GNAT family N-acetyltransferase [Aporhodopirellula aestuarii]